MYSEIETIGAVHYFIVDILHIAIYRYKTTAVSVAIV